MLYSEIPVNSTFLYDNDAYIKTTLRNPVRIRDGQPRACSANSEVELLTDTVPMGPDEDPAETLNKALESLEKNLEIADENGLLTNPQSPVEPGAIEPLEAAAVAPAPVKTAVKPLPTNPDDSLKTPAVSEESPKAPRKTADKGKKEEGADKVDASGKPAKATGKAPRKKSAKKTDAPEQATPKTATSVKTKSSIKEVVEAKPPVSEKKTAPVKKEPAPKKPAPAKPSQLAKKAAPAKQDPPAKVSRAEKPSTKKEVSGAAPDALPQSTASKGKRVGKKRTTTEASKTKA